VTQKTTTRLTERLTEDETKKVKKKLHGGRERQPVGQLMVQPKHKWGELWMARQAMGKSIDQPEGVGKGKPRGQLKRRPKRKSRAKA
jgi:hypothetical protein